MIYCFNKELCVKGNYMQMTEYNWNLNYNFQSNDNKKREAGIMNLDKA